MTILELCEPLFQHICRLSRMGRATSGADFPVVRSQIKSLFDEIREKAAKEVALTAQYQRLEQPLIYFVDSMIVESKLKISSEWHSKRMAYERNELAGDDKFFDLLEETLHDSSPEASEVLSVYYACLGLGFTGCYMGQPEQLRKYQNQIFPRIRHLMDANEADRICKEAYEHVDSRDLRQPPGVKMAWIGLLFVCLVLSFMIFYYWTYRDASQELREASRFIMKKDVPVKGQ
jgi:type IV/VI secretion system ImpK/VasF family protein